MRTPLQILVARDPADRRTDVYVDTLRLAFEGSADGAGSPSAYIADAIDLGIRVLEPAKKIRDDDAERLLRGARHTILVAIGEPFSRHESLVSRIGGENLVRVPVPPEPSGGDVQRERATDGAEPAKVLPHRPSVYSLERGSQVASGNRKIAYPGPKLSDAYMEAVTPMLTRGKCPVKLVTFDELEGN